MGDFNLDAVRLPDSDDEVEVQSKFDDRFFKGKVKIPDFKFSLVQSKLISI